MINIKISKGELIDRLSIIILKTAYITDKRKQQSIDEERIRLKEEYDKIKCDKKDEYLKNLIETNSRIWDLENKIRKQKTLLQKILNCHLGTDIANLNDKRHQIKRTIDEKSKIKEEKDYT